MDVLLQDLRYGARTLLRNRGFAAVAILTLALGIGANTAIFSVVNAVLIRPLPYQEPERLVRIWESNPQRNAPLFSIAAANYADWKARSRSFDAMAAYTRQQPFALTGGGEPEQVSAARCSSTLFPLLGAAMAAGRGFLESEDAPGGEPLAVVSYELAERRFGGAARAVDATIALDGKPFTVVGVLPPGFRVPANDAEVWAPLAGAPASPDRANRSLRVLARLAPGVTIDAARADMADVARQLEAEFPATNAGWSVALKSLDDVVVDENFRRALLVLLGAVGFVLLIACANVANLLLARAAARSREIAVREALGASRMRVLRQLLTEAALLAGAGGALGLLLASWGVDLLLAIDPGTIPRADEIGVDMRVLAFTVAATAATGLLFGLVPTLRASRVDLNTALKDGTKGVGAGGSGRRLRATFVGAEAALALVLLAGAGLLVSSFVRLRSLDLGFAPDGAVAMQLALPAAKFDSPAKCRALYGELLERLAATPGVAAVGAASVAPLQGGNAMTAFTVEGRPAGAGDADAADYRIVSDGYFGALGIRTVSGRAFTGADAENAQRAVVVNETMARRVWPGEDPLGAEVRVAGVEGPPFTVVGVVADVLEFEPRSGARPTMYLSYLQNAVPRSMTVVARTEGDEGALVPALRGVVREIDADVPVPAVTTMDEVVARSVAEPRFHTLLLAVFAAVALALAAAGIYGLVAYTVVQRTHEIGIRMALGARPKDIARMIVADGLLPTAIGIGIGVVASLALGPVLASLLFGVSAYDPSTLAAVSLGLGAVALLASVVPARRAMRLDPVAALRDE